MDIKYLIYAKKKNITCKFEIIIKIKKYFKVKNNFN